MPSACNQIRVDRRRAPDADRKTDMRGSSGRRECAPASRPEDGGRARLCERHGSSASGSCLLAPTSEIFLPRQSLSPQRRGRACVCWSRAPHGARLVPSSRLVLLFLYHSVVAGADVARRALDPRLPLLPGICGLPNPSSSWDTSQRVHNTHQPAARHGANRRGERAARLSLPRRRTAGGRGACRRGSGSGSSALQ